jgi:hypothetical protein
MITVLQYQLYSQKEDKNIFLKWQRNGYEYVDYQSTDGKVYHVIPDQVFWNKYGYNAARNGLSMFYWNYGNRVINVPKDGMFIMNQDNGVFYVDVNGNPITHLVNVMNRVSK